VREVGYVKNDRGVCPTIWLRPQCFGAVQRLEFKQAWPYLFAWS